LKLPANLQDRMRGNILREMLIALQGEE